MQLFHDHAAPVTALAFAPDGVTHATADETGAVWVRCGDAAELLIEPGPKAPAVRSLAFFPDGALAVGHAHGWHLFKRADGTWRGFGPPSAVGVTGLAAAGPHWLAIETGDRVHPTPGAFELWDLITERRVGPVFREPNGVRAVAAAPGRDVVAWATGHMKAVAWDVRKRDPITFPLKHTARGVALAPDGRTLAVAADRYVKLFDLGRKEERALVKGHTGVVTAVAFNPDGATLATASWDQTVRVWDAATGRERAAFAWPIGKATAIAYAADGLRIAAGGAGGAVVVWDAD